MFPTKPNLDFFHVANPTLEHSHTVFLVLAHTQTDLATPLPTRTPFFGWQRFFETHITSFTRTASSSSKLELQRLATLLRKNAYRDDWH
jgi:hypothetical protein